MRIFPPPPWLVLLLALAGAVAGIVGLQTWTLRVLLLGDVRGASASWTRFISGKSEEFGRIAAGEAPSPETQQYVKGIETSTRIFRYSVYDVDGVERYRFDHPSKSTTGDQRSSLPDPAALVAINTGARIIDTKVGGSADDAPFQYFGAAYLPVFAPAGKVNAVVKVFVDQTGTRAQFLRVLTISAGGVTLLIALAFSLPALAWHRGEQAKRRAADRLRYLSEHDALSGLPNRACLVETAQRLLDAGGQRHPLAVLKIDIDRFSDLSSWLGVTAGDQVIRVVAERLRAVVAPGDNGDLAARFVSDEFGVLHCGGGSRASAMVLAERIGRVLAHPFVVNGRQVRLSVCIGVALAPADGDTAERLLKSAHLALARAKTGRGGRVQFFTPDLDAEMEARRVVEQTVAHAFAHGGFVVHYQPICSLATGRLVAFEALARLPTEDGGMIQPGVFVPAIERMGLINQLGAWMLTAACTAAASWPEHLSVAVNLSALQFASPGVADVVASALKGSGLAPHRLQVEITETALLGDRETVMAELTCLKRLGARIVMDDFGTGYSSLSYLWRFPFDKIKIDGSFMTALEGPGAPAEQVMRAVTALGHSLGMAVCVEGVETHLQAASALKIGCDEVQGFHFGRPIPATELPALILADFRRSLPPPAPPDLRVESAGL